MSLPEELTVGKGIVTENGIVVYQTDKDVDVCIQSITGQQDGIPLEGAREILTIKTFALGVSREHIQCPEFHAKVGKCDLHGTIPGRSSMQNGKSAICMEQFSSGVPCKTGKVQSAWNNSRPEFHAKREKCNLHGTIPVRSSMQNRGMCDLHGILFENRS